MAECTGTCAPRVAEFLPPVDFQPPFRVTFYPRFMNEVISDLPRDDRPRERLLKHGAETLSNSELIAILIGSGMHGKNALQLSRELLGDGLHALAHREVQKVAKVKGMGVAKATRIFASIEL